MLRVFFSPNYYLPLSLFDLYFPTGFKAAPSLGWIEAAKSIAKAAIDIINSEIIRLFLCGRFIFSLVEYVSCC